MKVNCVCAYCLHGERDVSIEINFSDNKVYYYCPECKKENIIDLSQDSNKSPYPKMRSYKGR